MGASQSRVDKIVSAYRQNNLQRILDLCNFENGKITHNSIKPHEIVEIIKIFKTIRDSRHNNYYLMKGQNKYQSLSQYDNLVDGVHFMITNVCYKMTCLRNLPILIELLYKEKISNAYLENIIKNLNSTRIDIGVAHSSIITYLTFCHQLTITNQQLHELLVLLERYGVHLNVNPQISIYRNDSGVIYRGDSILIHFASKNYYPIIKLLLESGADYRQINKYGMTYYDYLNDELKEKFQEFNPYINESNA